MNCVDAQKIFNDATRLRLSAPEAQDLRAHLASCPVCDSEWQAQSLIAAMPVVLASSGLLELAQRALHVPPASARRARSRSSLFVAGAFLVGAAAAGTLIGRSLLSTEGDETLAQTTLQAVELSEPTASEPRESGSDPVAAAAGEPDGGDMKRTPAAPAIRLDSTLIAVLPFPSDFADAEALALSGTLREEIVSRIGQTEGLRTVDSHLLQTLVDSGMSDTEIGRLAGAAIVLFPVAERRAGFLRITFDWLNTADETVFNGLFFIFLDSQGPPDGVDPAVVESASRSGWEQSLARMTNDMLQSAYPALRPTPEQRAAEQRAVLLNPTFGEEERVQALRDLWASDRVDSIAIDAAIGLLESSRDPEIRREVVFSLMYVDDPRIVPTLLRTLTYDPGEAVRLEAATLLGKFPEEPGVRQALELAERNDEAQAVRDMAAVARLPTEERMRLRRENFFNEDLPVSQRVPELNIAFADRRRGPQIEIDHEIARELVDIAVNSPSADGRYQATIALYWAGDFFPEFEPEPGLRLPLVEMLTSDSDAFDRSAAAAGLRIFTDHADVREALENVRDTDPDNRVRSSAANALDPVAVDPEALERASGAGQ